VSLLDAVPFAARGARMGDEFERSPLGLYLPPKTQRREERPVGIDFFAGAGGFSMGFHQAGFHMAAAIEMDPWAAVTYLVNLGRPRRYGGVQVHYDTDERADAFGKRVEIHLGLRGQKGNMMSASAERAPRRKLVRPSLAGEGWLASEPESEQRFGCEHFWVADIKNLTGAEILDALEMEQGDVAVIVGGPPCQGFSAAGRRDVMDPRNSLVFEYARIICEIMPRTFVMENVPQIETMVTPEGVPVLDAFALAVSDGGYGEYAALRRALQAMGGRAGVRGAKNARRERRAGGEKPPPKPTKKVRSAVQTASDGQLDLLGEVTS
jgi:DNA (cytosine-5)-methyltransferase 1